MPELCCLVSAGAGHNPCACLVGFITGKKVPPQAEVDEKQGEKVVKIPNPAYEDWVASDQQVLGFLLSMLSKEILPQVATTRMVAAAWAAIEEIFASHTRTRTINIRLVLSTTKKETMTVSQYYTKMKALGDEMAAAGKPLDDEEMIGYILNGLESDFNPVVSALVTRVEPTSMSELYSQLISFETRLEIQQGGGSMSSANTAGRGGGCGGAPRGIGRGRGGRTGFGGGSGRGSNSGGRGHGQ